MNELTKIVLAAVAGSAITAVINYYVFKESEKPVKGIHGPKIYSGGCGCGCNKQKQRPTSCPEVITL